MIIAAAALLTIVIMTLGAREHTQSHDHVKRAARPGVAEAAGATGVSGLSWSPVSGGGGLLRRPSS